MFLVSNTQRLLARRKTLLFLLKLNHCLVFILPGSTMCILYTHHGGVLGDRGCGAGCHCSPSSGSVSVIWCPWIQTSLYSLLQGHKRTLLGRLDCCSRCGTMEFTQTDRSSNSLVGGSSASTVGFNNCVPFKNER